MALTTCTECGKQVSEKAASCPNCGAPVAAQPLAAVSSSPKPRSVGRPVALFGAGVLLFILFAVLRNGTGPGVPLLRQPKVLFSQRIELKEGAAEGYGFTLTAPALVQVSLSAMPKPVNVMLMSEDQWQAYQEVRGRIFGGRYWYKQSLSQLNTLKWTGRDQLPPGQYRIVVERPKEALFFGHPTVADVQITAT